MTTMVHSSFDRFDRLDNYPKCISEVLQVVYIFCGLRLCAMCIEIVELRTVIAFLDLMIFCVVFSLVIVVTQRGWERLVQWWSTFYVLAHMQTFVTGMGGLHCTGSSGSAISAETPSTGITRSARNHIAEPHKCCEICTELYNNTRRPAISGRCGHVYCSTCLVGCKSCPACRVEFSSDKIVPIFM